MTTTIALDEAIGAAQELARAGRWSRAASLLDTTNADNDKDRARIALAAAEVAVASDWFAGTEHAGERLKTALKTAQKTAGDDWDLAYLTLRIDYRATIFTDGFQPGPEGKDPNAMADLRRRAEELRQRAPDGIRAGWASFYLGVIADNVFGERDAAPAHYEAALQGGEEGDDLLAREALRHLGDHAHESGDFDLAYQRWARATELGARAGTVLGTLSQQILLATLARDTGDKAGARLLAREIARWAKAIGSDYLAAQAIALQKQDDGEA